MREILFRGQDTLTKKFVYGQLVQSHYQKTVEYQIMIDPTIAGQEQMYGNVISVVPETIGQYVGMKDKDGIKAFSGDCLDGSYEGLYIGWCEKCCSYEMFLPGGDCLCCQGDLFWHEVTEDAGKFTIIGNIHNNPELVQE